MIRVLIAAPYASLRAGFRAILAQAEDMEIAGEAAGSEAVEVMIESAPPDVLLLDDAPPDGARTLEHAQKRAIPVVMLGESRDGFRAMLGIAAGWGYLLKDAQPEEILGAIRGAAAGLAVLERSLAIDLDGALPVRAERESADLLTDRERDVLQLIARGLPNKAIAGNLGISQHTVKFHVASILSKLGAGSRTEAVSIGARSGLVSL